MNKRKTYKHSEKCELSFVNVGWNVLDNEQLSDLKYIESFPNKAGKIRECVRICRTGQFVYGISLENSLSDPLDDYDFVSNHDSIHQLID